jgi:2-haloacid dehalogenase
LCAGADVFLSLTRQTAALKAARADTRFMKSVIFDLGGVLIDWNPRPAFRKSGLTDEKIESFIVGPFKQLHWLAHDSRAPFAESLTPHLAKHPDYALLIAMMIENWDEFVGAPIGGTVALLEELAQTQTRIFALSNWPAQTWPPGGAARASDFAFLACFADIIVSGEVGLRKPDPAIFRLAQQRFDIDPQHTLFVDDLTENIKVADSHGFKTHLFTDAATLEAALVVHGFLRRP